MQRSKLNSKVAIKRADYLECRTWLRSRTAGGWEEMTTAATYDTRNVAETDLISCVPHLRAFAWFLTKNRERADELVQDTIVRALTEAHPFEPGTSLKAWMFTILRSLHCNEQSTSQIRIQSLDDPLLYEPAMLPSQVAGLEFGDFRRAFWQLGDDLREVLILVGASGLSYQDAAMVCGCRKGTMISRMSRARRELLRVLEDGLLADKRRAVPWPAGYIGDLLDGRRANFHQSRRGMRGG
jgi:RNA polymerase sigma-70 factor, ECF subfamily